jgi:WD40 repeat protein
MHEQALAAALCSSARNHMRWTPLSASGAPLTVAVTMMSLQDYIYLHREHTDWVTQVEWIPEIGLVTSSLDTTIKVGRCVSVGCRYQDVGAVVRPCLGCTWGVLGLCLGNTWAVLRLSLGYTRAVLGLCLGCTWARCSKGAWTGLRRATLQDTHHLGLPHGACLAAPDKDKPRPPRTPQVWDIARERMTHVCSHHTKGVHAFVWCKAYSLFASCGMERDVTIWQVTAGAGDRVG